MEIIIFDDDFHFRRKLETIIRETSIESCSIKVVLSTGNTTEVMDYAGLIKYPALFLLDIIAENKVAGLELSRQILDLNENNFIVFLTGYPSRIMFDSKYKLLCKNIILKKSMNFELEIKETVLKALEWLTDINYFTVESKHTGITKIRLSDIFYFEKVKSKHSICMIHANGFTIFTGVLKDILEKLNGDFMMCHKCFIVNISNVRKANKVSRTLHFQDDQSCPYSEYYKRDIFKCLRLF